MTNPLTKENVKDAIKSALFAILLTAALIIALGMEDMLCTLTK